MPERPLSPAAADLLRRQDGVATRRQLLEAGVSRETVLWRPSRAWRIVLPRVYLVSSEPPTQRQRLIAGLLWAGPGSAIAGATAAQWHGIRSADARGRVQLVTAPPRGNRQSGFATVRRSLLVDPDEVTRGVLRLSCPARSAVDAAFAAPTRSDRSAILIEAVQRRIVTIDALAAWAYRLRDGDRARLNDPLEEAASGVWSLPEAELLDLVAGSSLLPEPWPNPRLEDGTGLPLTAPDLWFDDVCAAVMVHSHKYHSGALWDETVERDSDLTAAGIVVVGVTPRAIRNEPIRVLQKVERTYLAAQRRPRPDVRAISRHHVPAP